MEVVLLLFPFQVLINWFCSYSFHSEILVILAIFWFASDTFGDVKVSKGQLKPNLKLGSTDTKYKILLRHSVSSKKSHFICLSSMYDQIFFVVALCFHFSFVILLPLFAIV